MADLFAVLADPTRRKILDCVREAEVSVNEIVARVEIKQSGVSRHLRILEESGLVRKRPDAQRRIYSVQPEPLKEMDVSLYFVSSIIDMNEKFKGELEESGFADFPNDQMLGGYDSIYVLDYILKECGDDKDVECLKKSLYSMKGVKGSRSEMVIDKNGDAAFSPIVKKFVKGVFEELR